MSCYVEWIFIFTDCCKITTAQKGRNTDKIKPTQLAFNTRAPSLLWTGKYTPIKLALKCHFYQLFLIPLKSNSCLGRQPAVNLPRFATPILVHSRRIVTVTQALRSTLLILIILKHFVLYTLSWSRKNLPQRTPREKLAVKEMARVAPTARGAPSARGAA